MLPDPQHEVQAIKPHFDSGVPAMVDVDEDDPPLFESEASYFEGQFLLGDVSG